jgi:hypothetical protein
VTTVTGCSQALLNAQCSKCTNLMTFPLAPFGNPIQSTCQGWCASCEPSGEWDGGNTQFDDTQAMNDKISVREAMYLLEKPGL